MALCNCSGILQQDSSSAVRRVQAGSLVGDLLFSVWTPNMAVCGMDWHGSCPSLGWEVDANGRGMAEEAPSRSKGVDSASDGGGGGGQEARPPGH